MDQQAIRQEVETLYSMAQSVRKHLHALADRLDEVTQVLERLIATAEDREADAQK